VQRRLKPAGVRLAVLVAGDQQPLALRAPRVEELPLLRIRHETTNLPAELLAVDRSLERLGKLAANAVCVGVGKSFIVGA
jgi:hypothetical protein